MLWILEPELRMTRLLVPLVFGILIIVPPQGYLAKLGNPGYHEGYLQFLPGYFHDFSDLSGYFGTFTPAHLWFILYLLIFSLIGLPVFLALKKEHGKQELARIAPYFSNPWVYILLFIFLTATEALPAPGGKNPFFFFFLYLAGYISSADERFSTVIDRLKLKALIFLVPYLPIYLVLTSRWSDLPDFSSESILLAFVRDLALWLTLIVILGYGKRYLSIGGKWLSYLNQAAFPVYIIHQTVLLIIGFFVLRLGLPIGWEYVLITSLSFLSCLGVYELLIRRNVLSRWLFGVKVKTSPQNTNGTIKM
ncbi:MAG: acyltransferase family protein [Desulfitobacteriaceae bacterium]